jgi:hypothetical protein
MVTLSELISINKFWSDASFVSIFEESNAPESQKFRVKFARSLYGSREVVGFSGDFIVIR